MLLSRFSRWPMLTLLACQAFASPSAAQNIEPVGDPQPEIEEAAQPPVGDVLTMREVLRSSARHAPEILAAAAQERQAAGRLLSTRGEFDMLFKGDGFSRVLGYYDGAKAEAKAYQPLTNNGGQVYAGYRVSRGDFPIYEDQYFTNKLGEVSVGGVFSLLRDRLTDSRRTKLAQAEADVSIASFERQMVAIGVQQRALDAYLQWVAAGQRVRGFRQLLNLAESRQSGIERGIRLGAQPAILSVENRQNIVQRCSNLVRAERTLDAAANDLSFFWRDALGRPVFPTSDLLPDEFPDLKSPLPVFGGLDRLARPDLSAILLRMDKARAERLLAENDLRPRLDVGVDVSKDLGAEGLGGPSRTPLETKVGVTFSMPLQRRDAQGRSIAASAKIDELQRKHSQLEDEIVVRINRLAIRADAAEDQISLARQDASLAQQLAEAERRRLFLGASDLLTVNLREQALLQARINLLDARYELAALKGELIAATADREQLELP